MSAVRFDREWHEFTTVRRGFRRTWQELCTDADSTPKGLKPEVLVHFRPYQRAVFEDRTTGVQILHWSRHAARPKKILLVGITCRGSNARNSPVKFTGKLHCKGLAGAAPGLEKLTSRMKKSLQGWAKD